MEYYLKHHGILGQKWGKKNGPPYPLDAEDHSAAEKKIGYQKSLNGKTNEKLYDRKRLREHKKNEYINNEKEKLIKSGKSEEQALLDANRKYIDKQTMKKIAVTAAAVGVTIAAAYAYRHYSEKGREYTDSIIKAGASFNTVTADTDILNSGHNWYATHKKVDNQKYIGLWGQKIGIFGAPTGEFKKNLEYEFSEDVKVAGQNTAKAIYDNLLKNDPDFQKLAPKNSGTYNSHNKNYGRKMNAYEIFMRDNLMRVDDDNVKLKNKFFDELKKQGYKAVKDTNDTKFSGFDTNAVIFFDNKGITNKKINDITKDEYEKARQKASVNILLKEAIAPTKASTASLIGGAIATGYIVQTGQKETEKVIRKIKKNKNKKRV